MVKPIAKPKLKLNFNRAHGDTSIFWGGGRLRLFDLLIWSDEKNI